MKNNLLSICIFISALFISNFAVSQNKPASWVELKAYHSIMSSTFHPSEEGNLEPIKARSGELAEAAKAWNKSTPPAEFNKPTVKETLKHLEEESITLDKLIKEKKATDAEIKAVLEKLHDRFHEVVGACKNEGEEHEHKSK